MSEVVATKTGAPAKPKRNIVKTLGIVSMAMWVVALGGAVYAWKAKKLPAALETTAKKNAKAPAAHEGAPAKESEAKAGGASETQAAEATPGLAPEYPVEGERDALRQLAELLYSQGELEKAAAPIRRLMLVPKRDGSLLAMATKVLLGTGYYAEALDAARQALKVLPDHADLRVDAVMAQYRLGKVEEAMKEAAESLQAHPGNIDMLVALGTMEIEMGPACPGYGQSLQAALKLKPGYGPALYLQGRKHQLEGNYRDAEIAFGKVLRLEPKNAKAHAQLGMALYHLHKETAAEAEYRKALALNPKDYNTWFNLGEVNLAFAAAEKKPAAIKALRQEAMESYLKAVELNPDHAEAHFRIGVLLNGNGEFKEALIHLEAAKKLDGRHVPTFLQLAIAYENLKRPDDAKACLQKALELDPLDKVVQLKLKSFT